MTKAKLTIAFMLYLTINLANAQDTLYIYKAGAVLYKQAVTGVDSITFTNTKSAINQTPWEVSDSIVLTKNYHLIGCNQSYIFLTNSTNDSIFVLNIKTKQIILSKAFATRGNCSYLFENVFINSMDDYSFSAYNISNMQNWSSIGTFTGLDKGLPGWQFHSNGYNDSFYYWIGHWNQTIQIFDLNSNSVVQHPKFNVGVNSESVSRLGNILYISNSYGENKKYDISNVNNPVSLGNFGNPYSNLSGTVDEGYVIQNHISIRGGGVDNIKIYDINNNFKATLNIPFQHFRVLSNGFCIVNGSPAKIYNIKTGMFNYVANLIHFSPWSTFFNDNYVVSMPAKTIYLINKQ